MLIEFSVANFRSIRELQTLSMEARKLSAKDPRVDKLNTFIPEGGGNDLLKVAGIFGGNASGKSNILKALTTMIACLWRSMESETPLPEIIVPFNLDEESMQQPTFFEIVFVLGLQKYRYGFEATKEKIVSEWLFLTHDKVRESYMFKREGSNAKFNPKTFPTGHNLFSGTLSTLLSSPYALVLDILESTSDETSVRISSYLWTFLILDDGSTQSRIPSHEVKRIMKDPDAKLRILKILQTADMNIHGLESVEYAGTNGNLELNLMVWKKRTDTGLLTLFNFAAEADGTKRLFTLGRKVDMALQNGSTLIVDEFDARLHPNLSRLIVELFQLPETNPKNAQLIFVSHDTQFMSLKLLRRDQIWFVKQNAQRATELYSLAEFKGVRNDKDVEAEYRAGLYGGVASLNLFQESFNQTEHVIETN